MTDDDGQMMDGATAVATAEGRIGTHGARSIPHVKATAMGQKRRLLRRLGLRTKDLDGIGASLLDAWSRSYSKVVLMDHWLEEHGGWVDDDGNSPGFADRYFAALNTSRLYLDKLAAHLAKQGKAQPSMVRRLQALSGGRSA